MGTLTMVDTRWWWWRTRLISWWLMAAAVVVMQRSITVVDSLNSDGRKLLDNQGVTLVQEGHNVVMENGIVSLALTAPNGSIAGVSYKGSENLLQTLDKDEDNGQWNIVWNTNGSPNVFDKVEGTNFKVILQSEDQTEISFTTTWKFGSNAVPLNVDKRFVMLRGSPGFYTYAVLERLKGWPSFQISEGRIVFQLHQNKFHYMAVSDVRQRFMPTAEDRKNGQVLAYKEAVLLTNPAEPKFKGEVDDKYFYTCNNEDNKVHGWVSNDSTPIGFWLITPSNEFRSGGPTRQDLTSHVGPFTLGKFSSRHYGGEDLAIKFKSDEYWKKVIGPFYIHLNSDASAKANPSVLWNKAKQRMEKEVSGWPYSFPLAKDFVHSDKRGSISGQLLVHDPFLNELEDVPGALAYVGLVPQAESEDSWQFETKGYQFWTHADKGGNFLIKNVIPGKYRLFAWVPGVLGDYKHDDLVTIASASILTTNLVFNAPREGPTLWEIGIPDRSAGEFFIPDPDPKFKIHRYASPVEKFRQYGLWDRYTDLYPSKDLVFTIGESNYTKDWFFAHVTRNAGNGQYEATTWQVLFDLGNVKKTGNYTLRLALASAQYAKLEVRFNDPNSPPYFTTPLIGKDNALARHGVRGVYYLYTVGVVGSQLVDGRNAMFLKQVNGERAFQEVMYDYIRLEGPVSLHNRVLCCGLHVYLIIILAHLFLLTF